jgi:hypothetical protein
LYGDQIKEDEMVRDVTWMGNMKNTSRVLVEKCKEKKLLELPRHCRWKDNIKVDVKEIE